MTTSQDIKPQDKPPITGDTGPPSPMPALTIDWELYGQYLEDSDLSDDEKREFIETLWSIMTAFVDLGFGIHPLQQVDGQQACEQSRQIGEFLTTGEAFMLNSEHQKQQEPASDEGQESSPPERRHN